MKSNIVAEIVAGLVGLAIMYVWGLGVLAIYAAVLLKVVDINSIFDIYFPGMTLLKWFMVAIMWSLVPIGIYVVGVALKVLGGQQKKNPPS